MNRFKIIGLIVLTLVFMSFPKIVNAQDTPNTNVLFQFDKTSYSDGDTIQMTFYLHQFQDIFGYQIDLKNQSDYFSINHTEKPYYHTSNNLFTALDSEWVNNYSQDIATIIFTRNLTETAGYSGTDLTKLISINMTANTDISNIYELFLISSNYNDLEYGSANLIIKLSDTNSNPIPYHFVMDDLPPTITGTKDYTLEVFDPLPDIASDINVVDDYDRNPIIDIDLGDLENSNTIGIHPVTITVFDLFGNQSEEDITISIVDNTAPEITLNGESELTIELGGTYTELGVDITDNYDINLTPVISGAVNTNEVGTYTITYQAIDSSHNVSEVLTRTIHVRDRTNPVVSLKVGLDTIYVGDVFTDAGVNVSDNSTTELTITVNNPVDTSVGGEYVVTYTVKDESHNETIIVRYVNVLERQPDVTFTLNPGKTTLLVNEAFTDPGCTVTYGNTSRACEVLEYNVENTVPGAYTIIYSVTINDIVYKKTRYVFVLENKNTPVLYFKKEEEEVL